MLSYEALLRISREVGAPVSRVETTISLLEGGATVPFISRYRKEVTGNLDEVKVRDIDELRVYQQALDERRVTVLASIEKQGKLTEELKQKILLCFSKNELEDLYLPFKPRRRTKANVAIEKGLGPLADYIWEQTGTEPIETFALQFVTPVVHEPGADVPVLAEPMTPSSVSEAPALPEPVVSAEQAQEPSAQAVVAEPVQPEPSHVAEPASEAAAEDPASERAISEAATEPAAQEPPAVQELPALMEGLAPGDVVIAAYDILTGAMEMPAIAQDTQGLEGAPSPENIVAGVEVSAPAPVETAAEKSAPPRLDNKTVLSVEDAIEGALHIVAERVAETPEYRKQLRDQISREGVIRARALAGKESEKTKYEMYYKFEETVSKIPSHRMLAIRRGARENVLAYTIESDREKSIALLLPQVIKDSTSQFSPYLERAVRDGYDRLMAPSIQTEVRSSLRERAETEAIRVFEENLRTLLLSPPAGSIFVIGLDPGLRTGCKLAVVDETGKFLENHLIRPTEPQQDLEGGEKTLLDLTQKYNVRGVVIGNGTGSRETEAFVRGVVQKHALDVFVVVVSEAGASVYSASPRAREEFPNLDVTVRGAISIARRLQDPLAELVKIEPRSIGVGQYQHDVDQRKLKHSLAAAVESSVNRVGVDVNTASVDLLKYVSGINEKLASGIVAFRDRTGVLRSRTQFREIEGFGEKTFEQSAGFLRIKDGDNPLDRTAVHPESYDVVERMAASLSVPVSGLIENAAMIQSIDFRAFEAEAGKFTVGDIREELLRPGRDPRDKFVVPKFREDVKEISDLKEGMELEGTVTNVTNFGAFVDLGVHQDGLVHISELSHKYIQDARQAAKVGEIVKVKVIAVDAGMKRISLSMKALAPKPPRPPRRRKAPGPVAVPAMASAAASAAGAGVRDSAPATTRAASPSVRPAPKPAARPQPSPGPANRGPKPGGPRPERATAQVGSSQEKDRKPQPPPRPRVETTAAPPLTMEEKIRLLQAKFGRVE